MPTPNEHLAELLTRNTWIIAAWYDDHVDPMELHIVDAETNPQPQIHINAYLDSLPMIRHTSSPIRTLVAPVGTTDPRNAHQACQDEPVQLGCQCQPQSANWVGTAGAPVSWKNAEGQRVYGILSNWHVMADGGERIGRTIHQPTSARAAFAKLTAWKTISPNGSYTFDAAIANALIGDYHTISSRILEIGDLCPTPLRARVGLTVCKSGRTTGLTCAFCTATGAAVRVSYGDFTALFEDQDVFTATEDTFSAPGDSGSLIVDRDSHCPVSLLFAGSSEMTIGNPIQHVVDHFGLSFKLN